MSCLIAPTNERTACIYDLKEKKGVLDASDDSCQIIPFLLSEDRSQTPQERQNAIQLANYQLIKCLDYHQKLKECKKEINYYIPALHPE